MSGLSRRPVLIGWSQVSRFEGEPLQAWAAALRATHIDPKAIDELDVVYCQSWPYDDPARRLGHLLGAQPIRAEYSGIGGTTPLTLLSRAAEAITTGRSDVCAVVGGEALATVRRLKKQGERPQWSHRDPEKKPFPFEAPFHPAEVAHQVFQAYTTFAMRDIARRAHLQVSPADYSRSIGELLAPMTKVAAANPHAWFPTERSAEEIMTVTPANRVVAHPYTKLSTAIMDVDLGAAFVVASEEAADRLKISPDRRVYVRGWVGARDPDYVAEHDQLWRSPAMEQALRGAMARAGTGADDIAHFDLYSCFASSVSFSLDALGIDPSDSRGPFTVTGGLPYAGGPGSCYAVGSVAAMADRLTAHPGDLGLVSAVGMHLSKHAAVVLCTDPGHDQPAPDQPAPAPAQSAPGARRPILDTYHGPATVAAYTVHHGPDGTATDAVAVCDVDQSQNRTYARTTDPGLLEAMEGEEWVARRVRLRTEGDTNWMEA